MFYKITMFVYLDHEVQVLKDKYTIAKCEKGTLVLYQLGVCGCPVEHRLKVLTICMNVHKFKI